MNNDEQKQLDLSFEIVLGQQSPCVSAKYLIYTSGLVHSSGRTRSLDSLSDGGGETPARSPATTDLMYKCPFTHTHAR